jgi:hypothetical protein
MEKYSVPKNQNGTKPDRYAYLFCLSGVMGIMKEWIVDGFPVSPREFAQIAFRCSLPSLSPYFIYMLNSIN